MTTQKQQGLNPDKESQDQYSAGVEAAMLRAAKLACHRAIETVGSVVIFRDGRIVREKDIKKIFPDDSENHSP